MAIRIESMAVKGLGPISSLQWNFKDINLIYGKNEKGKTYLTEYILRSLFKRAPVTRDLTDSGQVVVSGLDQSKTTFHPKTRQKLEDTVLGSSSGMQVDLSRLCVVKAGELSFSAGQLGGITKSDLKEYLSDQHVLDDILAKIPSTVQDSAWENGDIVARRQAGPLRDLSEKRNSLAKMDELLSSIEADYSEGIIKEAKLDLEKIADRISLQTRARRIRANELASLINQRQLDLKSLPEDALDQVKKVLARAEAGRETVKKTNAEIDQLTPQCQNYAWLNTAITELEKRPEGLKADIKPLYFILSILSIAFAVLSAFLKYPVITLGLGLVSILFIYLLIRQFQTRMQDANARKDVEEIFAEFESRFGSKPRSIAELKSVFDTITPLFYKLQALQTHIQDLEKTLSSDERALHEGLGLLEGRNVESEDPIQVISRIQSRRNSLLDEIASLNMKLAATRVQPADYLDEKTDLKYDPDELSRLEASKQQLEASIHQEGSTLETLKQRVCDTTNDLFSIGWDDLLDHLRSKRKETSEALKSVKAQIAAGILITGVITDLRAKEDESIVNALNSSQISEPVEAITHTYTGVDLDGEEIVVFNSMQRFPLSKMSTGVQEQILLALRIGLASHILGDKKLFLILDDAFQHSDWDRRVWLVDEMASLANKGWQILYFSMDEHIKHLFETRIKPKFADRYAYFELD